MCQSADAKAPNHITEVEDGTPVGVQILRPMVCVKNGVKQFLTGGHQHYPNVDAYECSECHRVIIRE